MKRILLAFLFAIFVVACLSFSVGATTLKYKASGNQITITDCDSSAKHIEIPSEIKGLPVTKIDDYAFFMDDFESITIPDSVTSIGHYAFFSCIDLKSITIPDSVTTIGKSAFYGCDSLTSITIPRSVVSIGNDAFVNCNGLTHIAVEAGNSHYSSDSNGCLFNKDKSQLLCYPAGKTEQFFAVPAGVTTIGKRAFGFCNNLANVTIPNGVTIIDTQAFFDCENLAIITILNGVTNIGVYAFQDCRNLTDIRIPESVTDIGYRAFEGCNNVTILCPAGSYARQYAEKNNMSYITEGLAVTIPEFKVMLNGMVMDSKHAMYPVILYNNITYFPMTYFDSRLMGLTTAYSLTEGLHISQSAGSFDGGYETLAAATPNSSMYTATIADFPIYVNGKNINNAEEYYPLLLFRDVTYFPLTWRFAVEEFGWTYNFDLTNGLVITK